MDTASNQLAEPVVESAPVGTEEAPRLSPLRVLTGILIRPRATFEKMYLAKRKYWWVVLVLMIAVTALLAYATVTAQRNRFQGAGFPEGFTPPAQGNLPEGFTPPTGGETAQQSAGSSARSGSLTVVSILVTTGTGVLRALLGYLMCAIVVFGVGLVMGGKGEFKQLFPVAAWSTLPLVLRKLVHAVVTLVAGKTVVAGLGGMLTWTESASLPLVYTLLGQFDFYLMWSLVLLGIGVAVTSKLSRGKSAVVVFVYLLIAAGLLLASSLATSALSDLLGTNLRLPGMMRPGRRG
jgi:hypothetical protein